MKGIAKVKGTVKILLDLDRVLGADGRSAARAPRSPHGECRLTPFWARRRLVGAPTCAHRPARLRARGITLHAASGRWSLARLQKRLQAGGFTSFAAYLAARRARRRPARELTALLDAIATNHTSFFREPQHFEFLAHRACRRSAADGRLRVWSAACSTGEEPVTIAITLLDALAQRTQPDACACSLRPLDQGAGEAACRRLQDRARREHSAGACCGVTSSAAWARRRARRASRRIVRRLIEYRQLNLLEIDRLNERFDVIFCRNVMIYFDSDVQQRVVSMLERHLAPAATVHLPLREPERHHARPALGRAGHLSAEPRMNARPRLRRR